MKMLKNPLTLVGLFLFVSILVFSACQKQVDGSVNAGTGKQLSVYLTDDPCMYDSVLIDIRYVEVKIDTSKEHMDDDHFGDDDNDGDDDNQHRDRYGKWDTLAIRAGVYNILKLRNGIDTLLGRGNLPVGKIRKIRLTLGENNSLVKSGLRYPLNLLAGANKYVYLKLKGEDEDEIAIGQSAVWIDFDVCESIKFKNGQYFLKPYLKAFSLKQYGKIEGKVFPRMASPFVKVFNNTDSATAMPEDDGEYKVRGLREGIYNIKFTGSNGYFDTTITNIQVRKGEETHIANITLRH